MTPFVFIFTALPCEAKPLIHHWKLKKQPNHPFKIFLDADCVVVISGLGKIAMAGAVGYTMSLFPNIHYPLLINFGIAGHQQHQLGSVYLADKIVDVDSGKTFYPQFPFSTSCRTSALRTFSKADTSYANEGLYDMEAAAFYEMACKFSCNELIHCIKIVSDNFQSPIENINEAAVQPWIEQNLHSVSDLIEQLKPLRNRLTHTELNQYNELTKQFHFTFSNTVKLKSLLTKWQLLNPNTQLQWRDLNANDPKALLSRLESLVEKQDFYL